MLKFCSLYSGSTGNSLYLESEHTRLLIDSGVSAKKIVDALTLIGSDIHCLDAILITHEHTDHVQGLGTLSKKFDIPVYANAKTWDAMPSQKDKILSTNQRTFLPQDSFEIGDFMIHPFSIPHDAACPCGFSICHGEKKVSIATDLGHMTTEIMNSIEGSDFLMLESNYDPEVLKCCSYPYPLKTRIAGPNGHLSNILAGKAIAHLIPSGLHHVLLGHLSKESNFPELAYKTVMEELLFEQCDTSNLCLGVANRNEPSTSVILEPEVPIFKEGETCYA